MKQFEILSGRCLVVEMPEGQQPTGLWTIEPNRLFYVDKNGCDTNITLPPGNWRIIGMLSEVTEEQAAGMVDKLQLTSYDQNGLVHYVIFRDYNHPHMLFKLATEYKETALESLESGIINVLGDNYSELKKENVILLHKI